MATTSLVVRQYRDNSISAAKISATLDEFNAPVASLDLNSQLIINLATPVSSGDAATKSYVDTAVTAATEGLTLKGSVTAATVTTLPAYTYDNGTSGVGATLTGNANGALAAQDGVTLTANEYLLVKDEAGANAPYNGIYQLTTVGTAGTPYVLTRATYFDTSTNIVPNSFVFVSEGSTLAETGWALNLDGTATVGTTDLVFAQFSGAGQITAGAGLSKSGNTLSVNVDDSSIEINSDALRVKALGVTNAMLAGSIADSKLSTITTGNKVSGSAVQLGTNGGLADSTGLIVNVDGSTITKPSGVLGVPTGGIAATQLASNAVTTVKITDANVTLAKIANAAANSKLLGSGAAGVGAAYTELTLGTGLSMSGTTLNAAAAPTFVDGETPSGTINGTNDTFTLANTPTSGSVALYMNGLRLKSGAGNDYTISTATITFLTGAIPVSGDVIQADYRY